jgi:hypothetical protein
MSFLSVFRIWMKKGRGFLLIEWKERSKQNKKERYRERDKQKETEKERQKDKN